MHVVYTSFIILFYLTACSVSSISLDVMRPAEISISQNIQNILIINRSLPSKSNTAENILDGILSGENIGDDKKGSEMCVVGLRNSLLNNNMQLSRFNIIDADGFMSGEYLKGTGTSDFPKPIKWKKINKLANNYTVDALIVLETFDSESRVLNAGLVERNKFKKGKKIKIKMIEALLNIDVYAGWRIYDVKEEKIIDEKVFFDQKSFSASGLTFGDAKTKLPNKRNAISEAGIFAGEQYAARISPTLETVTRLFYQKAKRSSKKENESFKKAADFLKRDKIAAAASIWTYYVDNSDAQIAGRACFNMALASELKNKYKLALDWINKAIAYDNEKAQNYASTLEDRQSKYKKIQQQLKK
mgnify:CR=1 FL=1